MKHTFCVYVHGTYNTFPEKIRAHAVTFSDNGDLVFTDWGYGKWFQTPYKKLVRAYASGTWTKVEREV